MRPLFVIGTLIVGCLGGYFGSPLLSPGAETVLVTTYTVLAGILVAVIVILGDPSLLPIGTWRDAEQHRNKIEARLIRHAWLFALYLFTVGLIFLSSMLSSSKEHWAQELNGWTKVVYLGLAIWAFLLSLALPKMTMDVQRERIDAEIERRRKREGINGGTSGGGSGQPPA